MLRAERVAKNQVFRRFVNEQIREAAARFDRPDDGAQPIYEFSCECADRTCTDTVKMSVAEYEEVRADATAFAVVPGHDVPSIERVIRTNPRFLVVVKFHPEAIRRAVEQNPRDDT